MEKSSTQFNPISPSDFNNSFLFQTNFFQTCYNNLYLAYQRLQEENLSLKAQLGLQSSVNFKPESSFFDYLKNNQQRHHDSITCKQEPNNPSNEAKFTIEIKPEKLRYPDSEEEETTYDTPKNNNVKIEEESDEDYEPFQKKILHNTRNESLKKQKARKSEDSGSPLKTNKVSKAKHLWDTYGRKITKYALKNTHGELHKKIEKCEPLGSKQAFINVFAIQFDESGDTNKSETEFKREYAKLALKFIESEAKTTFLNLKYQNNLLTLKDEVKDLIERLTGYQDLKLTYE